MSITRNLGGDRLGAGNKQNVTMHGYERSTHDLSYVWKNTQAPGTLVPFMSLPCLPGDTWDIDLDAYVNTHPTIGPLFGSFKLQLDVFQCPVRLYQGQLHNNKLKIGLKMSDVKLPLISQEANLIPAPILNKPEDWDNVQVHPSCLFSYLGIRGIGLQIEGDDPQLRSFNAVPFLSYFDIFKQYYSNKQSNEAWIIHTPRPDILFTVTSVSAIEGGVTTPISQVPAATIFVLHQETIVNIVYVGTFNPDYITFGTVIGRLTARQLFNVIEDNGLGSVNMQSPNWALLQGTSAIVNWDFIDESTIPPSTVPSIAPFELDNIDEMRERILAFSTAGAVAFNVNAQDLSPYNKILNKQGGDYYPRLANQEGLLLKTYQSDLFNNWLNTATIDDINLRTAVSTVSGSFTIDTLNMANKVQKMLNRIAVSGGTYDDWTETVYDHEPYTRAENPIYHGGLSKEIVFEEIISTAGTGATAGSEPLGTLAGKGTLSSKHKGGKISIKCNEIGYIMAICSITPRLDYSQGNQWDIHLKTMDDFHKPQLDEIGFQELITEQMAWWETSWQPIGGFWQTKSAGKQPAWINYMTNINQTRGNFAISDNQMFMTLNRRYQFGNTSTDITTYIDPTKFNYIFAQTSLDAQNFWIQIGAKTIVRRKMSAKVMPNL